MNCTDIMFSPGLTFSAEMVHVVTRTQIRECAPTIRTVHCTRSSYNLRAINRSKAEPGPSQANIGLNGEHCVIRTVGNSDPL